MDKTQALNLIDITIGTIRNYQAVVNKDTTLDQATIYLQHKQIAQLQELQKFVSAMETQVDVKYGM